jgi:hypothetical protein
MKVVRLGSLKGIRVGIHLVVVVMEHLPLQETRVILTLIPHPIVIVLAVVGVAELVQQIVMLVAIVKIAIILQMIGVVKIMYTGANLPRDVPAVEMI